MSEINVKNIFDPVEYMLKRKTRSIFGASDFFGECNSSNESIVLIRDNNLISVVEGDDTFRHELLYTEHNILSVYIRYNKVTGRAEKWKLVFDGNKLLQGVDYELLSEGDFMNEQDGSEIEKEVLDDEL